MSNSEIKSLYLSGPMSGLPELNFPAFHAAAATLRSRGFDVISPAEIAMPEGATWAVCMRLDIQGLCQCDGIAMMPGWESSKGAQLELHIAHRLEMPVYFLERLIDG